ncbi:ATP-binding cassette domain-containing protein [Butyribacter sp.]|uniref:ABC transporter ATP-binding protein n=1 Tax=Butyribacter sp. TaxID=2822465 RepID=UPI002A94CF2D|nr:ABC transporter ATP-binding protein [Butyribacter sp.]
MELKIEKLVKSFEEKSVIKGAEYSFEKGKIYGLLGRNGAGKTTLFNCISGEMDFDSGKIYIQDEENNESMDYEKIGYVYSTPILPEFLTGYEFIKFFTDINKKKIKNIKTPEEYADMVCLERSDLDKLIKGYSHGMKNKMQMLATIIASPDIILLDEPLTSLDVVAAHEMKEMLMDMKKDHIIIFSTHILQLAKDLCDEIVLLHGGNLSGVPEEIYHSVDFEEKLMQMLSDESETKVDDIESFNKTYIGGEVDENACVGVNTQPDVQASDRDYDPYDYD